MADPYYRDEFVTIYHGDTLELLDEYDWGRFDLTFADPPYNYGIQYDGYVDKQLPADYEYWCSLWFERLRAISDKLIVTPGHGNLPQWLGRGPAGVGCWYKPGNPSGAGIFQFCEWEPFLVWGAGRLGGSDVVKATLNPEFKGDTGHPCPKPVKFMKQLIVKVKASTVLDPFLGSGTTLVAAKALGLSGVGIEQSERYCELAAKRLAQGVLDLNFGGN